MGKFDRYAFSAQPSFNEAATRQAFSRAVPLKTLVIYCYDPRAAEIPNVVAKLFGDEVFPGEIILDGAGNRVASSTTPYSRSSLPAVAPSTRFAPSPSRSTCSGSRTSSWSTTRTAARRVSRPTASSMPMSTSTISISRTSTRQAASASPTTGLRSSTTPPRSARMPARQGM